MFLGAQGDRERENILPELALRHLRCKNIKVSTQSLTMSQYEWIRYESGHKFFMKASQIVYHTVTDSFHCFNYRHVSVMFCWKMYQQFILYSLYVI